ncbi:flavin-containing monooxygenase [Sphingomonas corticis]|uniref:NAD(P)/FAD-dependent oxidoreductase n=1 Tax=Sphingomonas corticis TaxID=2722791 RepID=A0ABX1CVS9_9SPHN|nr:NAD(P)/FAD-dependent oxidoreductase [Sphingomonas corticis]NJR80012.1 NAD(P)/FAD-dependent oxidoreductase [Sphingomonas corticis]
MDTMARIGGAAAAEAEDFDVVIVGAGIAGIGSAYHLLTQAPGRSFVVIEEKSSFGGTWFTHRYPGARSDSDLHTFGYGFKPWSGPPIATASEILSYMGEVIAENGLDRFIRYGTRVISADWCEADARWTLTIESGEGGERRIVTASFLWMCQGYYRHSAGYMPEWPGMSDFRGMIVHPQHWPDDIDLDDKRVVVIGSGATAATLIPALASRVAHVTMLQRSPGYFTVGRNRNELAETLRELEVDPAWIHEIVRRSILSEGAKRTRGILANPERAREELLKALGEHLDHETITRHFTPSYDPWRQRICFVPDGDFFKALGSGRASVVTDEIDRFVESGLLLRSGENLAADVIVTATGFSLAVLGDIAFSLDGEPLDLSASVTYRGMMFTGVPNLVWVFGYFRASWTLRADLIGDFVPRLLRRMDERGASRVRVQLRPEDEGMELGPWVDPADFNPGYLTRDMHRMPRSGSKAEWRHTQEYWLDRRDFPSIDLDDAAFSYG